MNAQPKTYFAHPISSYGSAEEKNVIAFLEAKNVTVVNPSDKQYQQTTEDIKQNFRLELADQAAKELKGANGDEPTLKHIFTEALINGQTPENAQIAEKFLALKDQFNKEAGGKVMQFFTSLADTCDACVIMPFPKNELFPDRHMFGAGAVKEANKFLAKGQTVEEVSFDAAGNIALSPLPKIPEDRMLTPDQSRAVLAILKKDYVSSTVPAAPTGPKK
jgi:hypothetical protein